MAVIWGHDTRAHGDFPPSRHLTPHSEDGTGRGSAISAAGLQDHTRETGIGRGTHRGDGKALSDHGSIRSPGAAAGTNSPQGGPAPLSTSLSHS